MCEAYIGGGNGYYYYLNIYHSMQSMLIDVEVEGNDVNMDDWEGIFLEGVVVRVK